MIAFHLYNDPSNKIKLPCVIDAGRCPLTLTTIDSIILPRETPARWSKSTEGFMGITSQMAATRNKNKSEECHEVQPWSCLVVASEKPSSKTIIDDHPPKWYASKIIIATTASSIRVGCQEQPLGSILIV